MGQVYVGAGYPDDCFIHTTRKRVTPNRLFTFAFFNEWNDEMEQSWQQGCNLMLDSGAFSVYTGTARVDRDEHTRFIERYGDRFQLCAALDVIFNPEETYENYRWQRERVPVFPVFHADDPWDLLLTYEREGATRIGIGGVARTAKGKRKDENMKFLHRLFDHLCDPAGVPRVMTHGFAMGTNGTAYSFPWTTVDSATATRAGELGRLLHMHVPKDPKEKPEVWQIQLREQDVLLNETRLVDSSLAPILKALEENGYTLDEVREFFPLRLAHNTMEMMKGQSLIPATYQRPHDYGCLDGFE